MRMNLKLDLNYKKKKEEERENKMLNITIFNRDKITRINYDQPTHLYRNNTNFNLNTLHF
ncbi:unnamed protein product [marine sediment metagenome]|uniref:Uncharacterized protein n=1 Tax=marine sediment metagenome TaxID=412755 RepID=X1C2T8_9ZZZZ